MYKISQSVINKRKRSPFFVALYVIGLATLFSLPSKGAGFDWVRFTFIFGITGVLAVGSNILGTRRFLAFTKNHEIHLLKEGLKSIEQDGYNVLPWENVTEVKQKIKGGKVIKLVLKASSGSIDLSSYGKLDELSSALKQYVKTELWK
ncbi:hypothetical protein [Shewanella japonica]|uniref:DUF304 domain-containing protein n=1 Tax=Shewanella japonica TaxID=93973 RepID=A0ABN4YF27_9GAMM|nr:hypothetical protein [Shewanella japonica]ARD21384.1 hypothetical protein SJ2017_1053 [Shewanella japonica]